MQLQEELKGTIEESKLVQEKYRQLLDQARKDLTAKHSECEELRSQVNYGEFVPSFVYMYNKTIWTKGLSESGKDTNFANERNNLLKYFWWTHMCFSWHFEFLVTAVGFEPEGETTNNVNFIQCYTDLAPWRVTKCLTPEVQNTYLVSYYIYLARKKSLKICFKHMFPRWWHHNGVIDAIPFVYIMRSRSLKVFNMGIRC